MTTPQQPNQLGRLLSGQDQGPKVSDLPDILSGRNARKSAGETPILPVLLIVTGIYLVWFGVRYWRDTVTIWPTDPVKDLLQGKGLPKPDRSAPVASFMQSEEEAGAAAQQSGPFTGGLPGNATGQALAKDTARYIGGKYVWGGGDPHTGADCSGLVNYAACHDLGLDIPGFKGHEFTGRTHGPNVAEWIAWPGVRHVGAGVFDAADIQAGDILAWGPNEHMGVALDHQSMVSAEDPAQGIAKSAIEGFFSFPPVILRLRQLAQAGTASGNQNVAKLLTQRYGWSPSQAPGQFAALVKLWTRESGWRTTAENPSGAYGIPQALPGDKMASAGADWRTDAATQIRWGLRYIKDTYGSPEAAWAHEEAQGWY